MREIRRDSSCHESSEASCHRKGCRPGRPLCRVMRKVRVTRRPCGCDAYHYPHRTGSGRCGEAERAWALVEIGRIA